MHSNSSDFIFTRRAAAEPTTPWPKMLRFPLRPGGYRRYGIGRLFIMPRRLLPGKDARRCWRVSLTGGLRGRRSALSLQKSAPLRRVPSEISPRQLDVDVDAPRFRRRPADTLSLRATHRRISPLVAHELPPRRALVLPTASNYWFLGSHRPAGSYFADGAPRPLMIRDHRRMRHRRFLWRPIAGRFYQFEVISRGDKIACAL